MSQLPHDPNSLNEELDRRFTPGQGTSPGASSDPLLEAATRLNAAPRPRLSPEAAARIRATVIAAQAVTPKTPAQRYLPQSASARLALVAAVTVAVIVTTLFAARNSFLLLNAPPTAYSIVTQTRTPAPSATPSPTSTLAATLPQATTVQQNPTTIPNELPSSAPSLIEPTLMPSSTPIVPTTTPASTLTETPLPPSATTTPAPPEMTGELSSLPVVIIVEGPIQTLDGNIITIFDLTVQISPDNPLLSSIQIGDVLRVEGTFDVSSQVVIAVQVTQVIGVTEIAPTLLPLDNPEGSIDSSAGEVWVDSGDCSNPPPDWAPANGWRRRCEGAASPGNSGGQGQGQGQGQDHGHGN